MADSAAETAQDDSIALADDYLRRPAAGSVPPEANGDAGEVTAGILAADTSGTDGGAGKSSDPVAFTPGRRRGSWLGRVIPAPVCRRLATFAAWSHTPRALRLGTVCAGSLALLTAATLALVGFGGVGTHVYLPPAPQADALGSGLSNDAFNFYPPVFPLPPLIAGPPLPVGGALSGALSQLVLQPYDVPIDFESTDRGAVSGNGADGLAGSYHVLFQRALGSQTGGELGGSVAVISIAAVYRDLSAATAQIEDEDLGKLGTLAGLPDLSAEPVPATRVIGDESRVVHLAGESYGVQIGAYLVEFRHGAVDGIVALVAPAGSESLPDALLLAARQEARLEQSAPPQS